MLVILLAVQVEALEVVVVAKLNLLVVDQLPLIVGVGILMNLDVLVKVVAQGLVVVLEVVVMQGLLVLMQ